MTWSSAWARLPERKGMNKHTGTDKKKSASNHRKFYGQVLIPIMQRANPPFPTECQLWRQIVPTQSEALTDAHMKSTGYAGVPSLSDPRNACPLYPHHATFQKLSLKTSLLYPKTFFLGPTTILDSRVFP